LPAYQENQIQGLDPFGNVNVHSFAVVASSTTTNISFSSVVATACVFDACDQPNVVSAGDGCVTVVGPESNGAG
jgi:hypothetical protein